MHLINTAHTHMHLFGSVHMFSDHSHLKNWLQKQDQQNLKPRIFQTRLLTLHEPTDDQEMFGTPQPRHPFHLKNELNNNKYRRHLFLLAYFQRLRLHHKKWDNRGNLNGSPILSALW